MPVPAIIPDIKPKKSKPRKAAEKRQQNDKRAQFHEVENVWYIAEFAQLLGKHKIDKKALLPALKKKGVTAAILTKARQNEPIRQDQADAILKALNGLIKENDENAETINPKKALVPGHYKVVDFDALLGSTNNMSLAELSETCGLAETVLQGVLQGRRVPQSIALTIVQGINLARKKAGLDLFDPTKVIVKDDTPKILAVKKVPAGPEEFAEWPPQLTAEELQAKPIVGNKWYPKAPNDFASA